MATNIGLAKWRSHKVVKAGRITGLEIRTGIEVWKVETAQSIENGWNGFEQRYHFEPSKELRARVPEGTNPVGGYYVQYEDGFESWSPAKAFEEGYTRVEKAKSWYPGSGPADVGMGLKAGAGQPMKEVRTVTHQPTLIERLRSHGGTDSAVTDMHEAATLLEQWGRMFPNPNRQGCKTAIA